MGDHIKFEEIRTGMAATGESMDQDQQIDLILSWPVLFDQYDAILENIKTISNTDKMGAKEMIKRDYESLQQKESKNLPWEELRSFIKTIEKAMNSKMR